MAAHVFGLTRFLPLNVQLRDAGGQRVRIDNWRGPPAFAPVTLSAVWSLSPSQIQTLIAMHRDGLAIGLKQLIAAPP